TKGGLILWLKGWPMRPEESSVALSGSHIPIRTERQTALTKKEMGNDVDLEVNAEMAKKQLVVSEKQLEVFMFIIKHVEAYGYQPSQQEVANALGVGKRAILDRLILLQEKGYLELSGESRDRGIRLPNVKFEAKFIKNEQGDHDGLYERTD